jgi:aminoglycoside phosphotransferase family enzyme
VGDLSRIIEQIRDWVDNAAEKPRSVRESSQGNRIVDGHGDVRCEGVCIVDGITIFDCIEFNDRFRCGDLAGGLLSWRWISMRLAGLIWDMRRRRLPSLLGRSRTMAYASVLSCYRAYVRGKVLSFRLDQPDIMPFERDRAAARRKRFRSRPAYTPPLRSLP